MAKQASSKQTSKRVPNVKSPNTGNFQDRNLAKVNPLKEQFEPTDSEPVSQHKRMAGAC